MSENFEKIKTAPLFWDIEEAELPELLEALDAHSRRYQKGEIIMPEGEKTDSLGLVMSGSVLIVQDDFWGNRNIMARITQGGIFAESFACTGEKLLSYLSAQAMKSGKNEFDISFDRQQLADYLCVDRSAMSAQLCALRDEGILKFRKNHFVLNRI